MKSFHRDLTEAYRNGAEYIKNVRPGTSADLPHRVDAQGCHVWTEDELASGILSVATSCVIAFVAISLSIVWWPPDIIWIVMCLGILVAAAWFLRGGVRSLTYRRVLKWTPSIRNFSLEVTGLGVRNIHEFGMTQVRASIRPVWTTDTRRWFRIHKSFALFIFLDEQFIVLASKNRRDDLSEVSSSFTVVTGISVATDERVVVTST